MTDAELIARLRALPIRGGLVGQTICENAASRIEALAKAEVRAEAAEAKLEKAVEALEKLLRAADTGWRFITARNDARAALAEIKGESHE